MTTPRSRARAVAFVAAQKPAGRAARDEPRRADLDPGRLRPGPSAPASPGWPIRSTSRASSGSHPDSGQPSASAGRSRAAVDRGFRQATRGERPAGYLELADRLFDETRARAALVRLRPARPAPAGRSGARLAAPAPGRPRGTRLDHRRLAGPSLRPGDPPRGATAGRSSSSSSTRRRSGSAGWSARRSPTLPFVDRTRGRAEARRRPRTRAHRRR